MAHSNPETYVITAWLEGDQWRYRARHIRSGEEQYFAQLEEVAAMMKSRTGVSPFTGAATQKKS